MPIHDWTRVPSGLFHEFHQSWSVRIKDALNIGPLSNGFYALVEYLICNTYEALVIFANFGVDAVQWT